MSSDPKLQNLINEIGEPVLAKALVRLISADRKRERWGLLIHTEHGLHLISGEEPGMLERLMGRGVGGQERVSIALSEINRIEIPPPLGGIQRFLRGPSQLVTVHVSDGRLLHFDVDVDGRELLEGVAAQVSR